MSRCPPDQDLSAFLQGTLSPGNLATVAEHVRTCLVCDGKLSDLRAYSESSLANDVVGQRLASGETARGSANAVNSATATTTADTAVVRLGPYELLAKLGQGGMGTVYKARHVRLDRIEAVKILPRDLLRHPQAIERFDREMRAVARLDHPHIVRAHHADEFEGQHYLVMEYVDGQDIGSLVKRLGPLGVADACEIIRQAAEGLQHACDSGLVHRDIKPSNLILSRKGVVKVLDLGLALIGSETGRAADELTSTGQIMGTLDYMAPEQGGDAHQVDIRADLYSLGASLYHLLVGHAPFSGRSFANPMHKLMVIANEIPRPAHELNPNVPPELSAIVQRLLSKTPADRQTTPVEVIRDLQPFCQGHSLLGILSEPAGPDQGLEDGTDVSTLNMSVLPHVSTFSSLNSSVSEAVQSPAAAGVIKEVASPVAMVPTSRRPSRVGLAVAGLLAMLVLGAIVFRISTDRGDVVITSSDPGVKVTIKRSGRQVDELELHQGDNKYTLWSGDYEIILNGQFDGLTLKDGQFTLTRNGTRQVHIERVLTGGQGAVAHHTSRNTDERYREIIRWVLSVGGRVEASFDGQFTRLSAADSEKLLPKGRPIISTIGLDSNQKILDEDLARLANLPDLENLTLTWVPITDQGIELLGNLPKLKLLQLDGLGLTEKSLVPISRWSAIEELSLSQENFTDSGVAPLGNLKQLKSLRAKNLTMTAAQTEVLKKLPALQTLWLMKKKLDDSTLENVAKLPHLKAFSVTFAKDSKITSEGARLLAHKRDLVLVNLGGTPVKNTGLAHLCELSELEHLFLDMTQITDDGLQPLTGLRKLKSLWLGSNHISDHGLATIAALKTLETLRLAETDVTDEGLPQLAGLSQLKTLVLDGTKVTSTGVAELRKRLPKCSISVTHLTPKASPNDVAVSKSGWHGWPADAPQPAIAPFDADQARKHQQAWAEYLKIPVEYTNSIGMKFRLIPPGEFLMGSTPAEIEEALRMISKDHTDWLACVQSEAPQHKVILTQPFYLGVTELTQGDHQRVMGQNPSRFAATGIDKNKVLVAGMDTTRHPVETVSWDSAVEFCAKLSELEKHKPFVFGMKAGRTEILEGTGYRLPTEAEWEFACRAGTTTKYWIGDKDEDLVRAGWFGVNSEGRTHAVGELKANPFGLFDVHGNVWEWVQDGWEPTYYGEFATKPAIDPHSPFFNGSRRLFRGGNFYYPAHCRSSARNAYHPPSVLESLGFRVALSIDAVRKELKSDSLRNPAWDFEGWARTVVSKSGDGQVVAVVKKLQELNPEFDGFHLHKVDQGAVVEFRIHTEHITDIAPLRALRELKILELRGQSKRESQLADLSPLSGMKLTSFNCSYTQVSNLTPLAKMKLIDFDCSFTPVSTLAAIAGMKLNSLHCDNTNIDDLSPLTGMPLTELTCGYTRIHDLSALKGMPLTRLHIHSTPSITDLSPLRGLPLTDLSFFHNTRVTDLSPLAGMKLTRLDCFTTGVKDLSPLGGMPLTYLQCANTKVSSLAPLKGMPLTELQCFATKVEDLSPLKGMPLKRLHCERSLVNDAALEHIATLKDLERLDLSDTKVTARGVDALRKKLPQCEIMASNLSATTSPFDKFDPAAILASQRFPWQPKELVSVVGDHRQRHWSGLGGMAVSPQGRYAATCGNDGVRVWEMTTQQEVAHFYPGGRVTVFTLAFSPDGKRLACGMRSTVPGCEIWDVSDLRKGPPTRVQSLDDGPVDVYQLKFSADSRYLMIHGLRQRSSVAQQLWDVEPQTPKLVATYERTSQAAFSPQDKSFSLYREDDQTIRVLDLTESPPREKLSLPLTTAELPPTTKVECDVFEYLPDGRLLTARRDQPFQIRELAANSTPVTLPIQGMHASLSADGKLLLNLKNETTVEVWNLDGKEPTRRFDHSIGPMLFSNIQNRNAALTPDGQVMVIGHLNGAVRFWDLSGTQPKEQNPLTTNESSVRKSALLGDKLITTNAEGQLRLWTPGEKDWLAQRFDASFARDPRLIPTAQADRESVVIHSGQLLLVTKWNQEGPRVTSSFVNSWQPVWASFDRDEKRLAILAGYDGNSGDKPLAVWDVSVSPAKLIAETNIPLASQVEFLGDDRTLITVNKKELRTWELVGDKLVARATVPNLDSHNALNPYDSAITSDRKTLIVSDSGRAATAYDVSKSVPVKIMIYQAEHDNSSAIALTHDGKTLATGGVRGVYLWDVATGVQLRQIPMPGEVFDLHFTLDGRHLITINGNGTFYTLRL